MGGGFVTFQPVGYAYVARDRDGNLHKGVMYNQTRYECIAQLRIKQLYPVRLRLIYWPKLQRKGETKPISYAEMSVFCKQMSAMLSAGIAIPQTLKFLSAQKISKKLQGIITELIQSLLEGESLFLGLSRHQNRLPPFFCSLVKAGEMTNTLETVFERLADYYEGEDQFRKQLSQLMAYPLILLICTVGVVGFLVLKIIPGFQEIYEGFETQLPLLTSCLLAISRHLTLNFQKYMVGILICAFILSKILQRPAMKKRITHLQYQIPFWGGLQKQFLAARLARTWSLLLSSGLEVLPVVEMTSGTSGVIVDEYLAQVAVRLKGGMSLTQALNESGFFPAIFLEMVHVGEESGFLHGMLSRVAELYEREGKNQMARFLTVLEPGLLIGISLIVGVIVLAVMLPLFDMIKLF